MPSRVERLPWLLVVFRTLTLAVFGGLLTAGAAAGERRPAAGGNERDLLPLAAGEFRQEGDDGYYPRESLYRLIDGAAEVYLPLGFRAAASRRYAGPDGQEIVADIFDMGSPAGAFGAYHQDMREGQEAGIGQESESLGSALYFWKDRYFVSIVALRETPEAGRAVLEIGRSAAAVIPREGAPPEIRGRLPEAGLAVGQVHYFRDWAGLNRFYSLAGEDLLSLGRGGEGLLARYRLGPPSGGEGALRTAILLVVRYPSAVAARRGILRFRRGWLPEADAQGCALKESGRWAALGREGRVLAAVLEAPLREDARRLLGEALGPGFRLSPE